MKNIAVLIFLLSFSIVSFSQSKRDKVKALKIAFITEKLNLTETEAQKFWPIYNAFESDKQKLRKESFEKQKNINFEAITEEEAMVLLKQTRDYEMKKFTIKNTFIDKLIKVLPAKKIILLEKVDRDFKQKIFKEFKNRQQNRGYKN